MHKQTSLVVIALVALAGCATVPVDVTGSSTQLELRSVQTREYDTLDKPMTMRAVVATLQDLGFTIDEADVDLGIITGTRLQVFDMRMTVTVNSRSEEHLAVRANARIGEDTIKEPQTYQDFFMALDKAMFLTMNNVD